MLSELCSSAGVEAFRQGMAQLTSVWFSGAEHSDLTEKMQSFVISGGVYGTSKNRIAVLQNKEGGKLKRILSMFFPPMKNMKILYPVLEKCPVLLPFCYVARPFKILFSGRLVSSIDKLKKENSTTKEHRDTVSELFDKLGI